MSPPSICRNDSRPLRRGLAIGVRWTFLAVVSIMGACFGGQTGTELTPEEEDDRTSTNGTSPDEDGGTLGGGRGETSTPTKDTSESDGADSCDGSETALARLEADTGLSLKGLQAFATQANPFILFFDDGSTSEGHFVFEFGPEACVRTLGGLRVLSSKVSLRLVATAAPFEVQLSGTALAYSRMPSGVGRVELDANTECAAATSGTPESTCVSLGKDLSGYLSARLVLSARLQDFGGSVQLLGVVGIAALPLGACQEESCNSPGWVHLGDVSMARTE